MLADEGTLLAQLLIWYRVVRSCDCSAPIARRCPNVVCFRFYNANVLA